MVVLHNLQALRATIAAQTGPKHPNLGSTHSLKPQAEGGWHTTTDILQLINALILEGHIHAAKSSRQFYQRYSSPCSHNALSGDMGVQRRLVGRVRKEDVKAGADGGGEQVEG